MNNTCYNKELLPGVGVCLLGNEIKEEEEEE